MTYTGRLAAGRKDVASSYCQSCDARLTIGEPRPSSGWPHHLRLTQEQHDELLVAAAEYRDLCIEAGEPESAIDFLDWIALDALGRREQRYPEADGAPPHGEDGIVQGRWRTYHHRHPDPLPVVSLPPMIRKVAS